MKQALLLGIIALVMATGGCTVTSFQSIQQDKKDGTIIISGSQSVPLHGIDGIVLECKDNGQLNCKRTNSGDVISSF